MYLLLQKFVEQNGGVRGGWDEYDHQTFLKWRQRYQVGFLPFIEMKIVVNNYVVGVDYCSFHVSLSKAFCR